MEAGKIDPKQIIPYWEKVAFAAGDLAANLIWMPLAIFLNPYLTDVCGISAEKAGAVVLTIRLFDLITDVGMGIIGDATRPRKRYGKYRFYIAWGAVPLALSGVLMFNIPAWSETAMLIYFGVMYLILSLMYTMTNVPYSAQMSIASTDHKERASLSALRMVGAQTGVLVISLFMSHLITALGQGDKHAGHFYTMSLFGVVVVGLLFISAKYSKDRAHADLVPVKKGLSNVGLVLKCWPWWLLLAIGLFTTFPLTIRFGTIPYYIKYYLTPESLAAWGGEDWMISFFYTSGTVCALIAGVLYERISKRVDKKKVFLVLITVAGISSVMFNFIPRDGALHLIILQILFSLTMGPLGAIMFATYTDVVALLKYENGRDMHGVTMAVGSVCNKSGWSIGPTLTLFVLGWVNYDPKAEQTEEVLNALVSMVGIGPAIACVIAFIAMFLYPLDAKKMDEIQQALKDREAKAA